MDELEEKLLDNNLVEEAIGNALKDKDYHPLLEAIQKQMGNKRCFLAPIEDTDSDDGGKSINFRAWLPEDDDAAYLATFTSVDEIDQGPQTKYVPCDIRVLLDIANETKGLSGIAINPWGRGIVLEMKLVNLLRKNSLLHDAIRYATEKHEGQYRKGTVIPYIVHPIETMQILHSIDAGNDLLMAGVLHDTLEDTDTTYEELELLFGENVANLVQAHSEDKTKTWEERKEKEIYDTIHGSPDLKALVFADKLANLRSIARDYARIGDDLWSKFNRGKEAQAWYYSTIQDALWEMQDYPESADAYWEFVALYKDIFVTFYIDQENNILYQQDTNGDIFALHKENPVWVAVSNLSENVIEVGRKYLERIEDNWKELLENQKA